MWWNIKKRGVAGNTTVLVVLLTLFVMTSNTSTANAAFHVPSSSLSSHERTSLMTQSLSKLASPPRVKITMAVQSSERRVIRSRVTTIGTEKVATTPTTPTPIKTLLTTTLTALLFLIGTTTPPAHATDITKGNQIFSSNCASCHLGGQNFINPKRTLQKEALQRFVASEVTEDAVKKFVLGNARHKTLIFPNVPGGRLSEGEWEDVVGYVVDQALGEKW